MDCFVFPLRENSSEGSASRGLMACRARARSVAAIQVLEIVVTRRAQTDWVSHHRLAVQRPVCDGARHVVHAAMLLLTRQELLS